MATLLAKKEKVCLAPIAVLRTSEVFVVRRPHSLRAVSLSPRLLRWLGSSCGLSWFNMLSSGGLPIAVSNISSMRAHQGFGRLSPCEYLICWQVCGRTPISITARGELIKAGNHSIGCRVPPFLSLTPQEQSANIAVRATTAAKQGSLSGIYPGCLPVHGGRSCGSAVQNPQYLLASMQLCPSAPRCPA